MVKLRTTETDMSAEVMVEGIGYVINVLLSGCKGNKVLAALLARAAYTALVLHSYNGDYAATGEALKNCAVEDAEELKTGVFDSYISTNTNTIN